MWEDYYTVSRISEAVHLLDKLGKNAKIIAGGTDLMLEMKKNLHPDLTSLIDISRIPGQDFIKEEGDFIHFGPLVTHNQCLVSDLLISYGLPLVIAAQSIGAAQIRNIGTIYGNIITASPANDTISALTALNAEINLRSKNQDRWVNIHDFYTGVRKTVMNEDELAVDIRFKKLTVTQKSTFVKKILREIHGISIANASIILNFEGQKISDAVITLGAVAPKITHAEEAEKFLIGKELDRSIIQKASELACHSSAPISDVRGSHDYRNYLVSMLVQDGLEKIISEKWREINRDPVLLWGNKRNEKVEINSSIKHDTNTVISTTINNQKYEIIHGQNQSLARLIRDEAQLTGTKLGCEEGECGSCTVYLNGLPVLSCLLPAPKAHEADITTIEGIAINGKLHPIQQAFIDEGAVQCGYCTPGFIMSAVKLLEEKPNPTRSEIMEGLAGNICRCTGYYSIVSAVEKAADIIQKDLKE